MNGLIILFDTAQPRIWDDWRATKLKMFQPLELTKAQQIAIESERTQLHNPCFVAEAPIPVAVMKPTALKNQQLWVPELRHPIYNFQRPFTRKRYSPNFCADIHIIVERLFGGPPASDPSFGARAGVYKKPETPWLHTDSGQYQFLIRSLALPFEFVRKQDEQRYPKLIETAKRSDAKGEAARQKLRDRHALQPADLNTLYLMPAGKNGLLHCSRPVPETPVRGVPSILSWYVFTYHGRSP